MKIMKKIKEFKFENLPLLILFMGMVSSLGSGIWLIMVKYRLRQGNGFGITYLNDGVKELVFCALMHIALAAVVMIAERDKRAQNN